ncbi:MAG: NAD(P)-dependent oxidoreductase, partial [Dehalococcoidia bacterium]
MKGSKPYRIVVAEPFDAAAISRLEEVGSVSILGNSSPDTLIDALPEADALLVRSKAHVTARIIEAGPQLKVIGRASPTIDHIDLRAARERSISVVYAPHVAVRSTAEFTLALILAIRRRIPHYDRELRDGKFDSARTPSGHEMRHQALGLLGIDPVADRLGAMYQAAFEARILYHDPAGRSPSEFQGQAVELNTL